MYVEFDWTAFLSFGTTVALIFILYPLAAGFGLMDYPDHRKKHAAPTPLIGGLAMLGGVVAGLVATGWPTPTLAPYLAGSIILVFTGAIDDVGGLHYRTRFLMQALAASLLVFWGDLRIDTLGNIAGFGNIDLGPLAAPFTIFAIVGMINAINMLDGIDGLAGTVCLGILSSATLFCGLLGATNIMMAGTILSMSILGFLVFNYRFPWRTKAQVFMGDAGSNFLGFSLAWLALMLLESETLQLSPIAILWIVGYPVIDTLSTMYRRRKKGASPFLPSHDHVHFLLLRGGFGTNAVVLIISGMSAVLAATAFVSHLEGIPEPVLALGFVILLISNHYLLTNAARITKNFRHLLTTAKADERAN